MNGLATTIKQDVGAIKGQLVSVNQTINFELQLIDAADGQEWLRKNSSTIAEVISDAVEQTPGFARALRG